MAFSAQQNKSRIVILYQHRVVFQILFDYQREGPIYHLYSVGNRRQLQDFEVYVKNPGGAHYCQGNCDCLMTMVISGKLLELIHLDNSPCSVCLTKTHRGLSTSSLNISDHSLHLQHLLKIFSFTRLYFRVTYMVPQGMNDFLTFLIQVGLFACPG